MRRLTVTSVLQQLIPPALLTYFFFAWRTSTFEIPRYISSVAGRPGLARIYAFFPSAAIGYLSVLYLKLYFLPKDRSVPPYDPPDQIRGHRVLFECLSPEEARIVRSAAGGATSGDGSRTADGTEDDGLCTDPLVNRCWKDECKGRWKPARARHCSECGVCRAGFDHHCAIFANCLTAADLPTFLNLLILTPIAVLLISLPILRALAARGVEAYRLAASDTDIINNWWNWWPSWVIAAGPVGRWVGGVILGWRALDQADLLAGGPSPNVLRVQVAGLALFGLILSLISVGLASTSLSLLPRGHLTIDRGRSRARSRTLHAIRRLSAAGQPVPDKLFTELQRWSPKIWFFVPFSQPDSGARPGDERIRADRPWSSANGLILPVIEGEDPYDLGTEANTQLILQQPGWRWLSPSSALRRGMPEREMFNWPIHPALEDRLRSEAAMRYSEAPVR